MKVSIMNIKAIAIAAAAAATATSGQAADLPVDTAPVDYVRIDDAYGAGFFVLPGTETAIKIGGQIRVEAQFNNLTKDEDFSTAKDPENKNQNFRSRANVRIDTRTQSELGLIRTFTDLQITSDSEGRDAETVELDKAFVQVGGLTVGRATSAFDLWTGELATNVQGIYVSDSNAWQASYTYGLTNGLTVTGSLEDYSDRRNGIVGGTDAGNTVPTFVGNARVDQGWGWAGVSGAVTKVDSPDAASSTAGYAIAAGFGVNLDMIAPGDVINFQAAYADGALSYVGSDAADAAVSGNDKLKTTEAWSVAAGYMHNWTSQIATGIEASYLDVDYAAVATENDFTKTVVAGSVEYTPVAGLLFSAGAGWEQTDEATKAKTDAASVNLRVQRSF